MSEVSGDGGAEDTIDTGMAEFFGEHLGEDNSVVCAGGAFVADSTREVDMAGESADHCPQVHMLLVKPIADGQYNCDLCDSLIPNGGWLNDCRRCDYSLCHLCAKAHPSEPQFHNPLPPSHFQGLAVAYAQWSSSAAGRAEMEDTMGKDSIEQLCKADQC